MAGAVTSAQTALKEYISKGEDLIKRCRARVDVHGNQKLARKIQAEVKFLNTLYKKDDQAIEMRLKSTNLTHLEAMVVAMETLPQVSHVLKRFQPISSEDEGEGVVVDVVCNNGGTWVKIIARKAHALHRIWAGGGQFGDKNVVEQGEMYSDYAQHYPNNFQIPRVLFSFCQGVSSAMKTALENRGILVDGDVYDLTANPYDMEDLHDSDSSINKQLTDEVRFQSSEGRETKESFWPITENDDDDVTSDSDEEILTASELLKRQMGHHDLLGYISKKEQDKRNNSLFLENQLKTQNRSQFERKTAACVSSDSENDSENDTSCWSNQKHLQHLNLADPAKQQSQSAQNIDSDLNTVRGRLEMNTFSEKSLNCDPNSAEMNSQQGTTVNMSPIYCASQCDISGDHTCSSNHALDSISKGVSGNTNIANDKKSRNKERALLENEAGSEVYAKFLNSDKKPDKIQSSIQKPDKIHSSIHCISQPRITKLNLDISSLISYISNLCHGHCNYVFKEPILSDQAAQERVNPVLPILDECFQDKELYVCETALADFRSILATVGGESECARADELLRRVTVVPDNPSARILGLCNSAKIKQRAKIIFGTGESMKAVTVTANSGFVRAAEHKGINIPVFLHESRALTEQKQATATPWAPP